ncbi:MAG: PocR ligand-binding domain-containing protein [Bacilli bacterium]|jgi:AraC-like DNA-binding protein|nr:PocR ligand-binding domain-containing protein [Bacilli bacterium]MCH4278353.1 PocR ligand-binding domain-containing protein [Bacilli bacterium]
MKSHFDLSALKKSISDFYLLSGIRISVFDNSFQEVASYPEKRSSFCEFARKNPNFENACHACDKTHILEASKGKEAISYVCHAGLNEIITPIRDDDGSLIGFLFFSHMLTQKSHDEAWDIIKPRISSYGFDENEAKRALEAMPLYDEPYLQAASLVLQAAASYLCHQNVAYLQKGEFLDKVTDYINDHLQDDLSIESLCKAFYVSRATLYSHLKKRSPDGVASYIRSCRIEKAKELLRNDPSLKISEVAELVGFSNDTNFIVAFRQKEKTTPKRYALSQKSS